MLRTELLEHQVKTLEFAYNNKCIADFSKMGTGKSLSAIAVVDKVKLPTVVVCPPYLVNNWLYEIEKHSDMKASPRFLEWREGSDITVVPYTQISKAEEVFKNCSFVVADEAAYLKNLDAKRTMYFHTMFYKYPPQYFMALTATPLKNRIPEIYSLLLLFARWGVKPAITDKYKSYYTFCCRFTNVVQGKYGIKYGGMKNVEELRTYIKPHSIKHEASVLNLPELRESNVVVSYKEDAELEKAFQQFQESHVSANVTAKVQSAISKASFTANYVTEAIESEEGPVVVFSDHKKPLEIMELELSSYRVRKITGEVSMDKRTEFIQMFQNNQLDVILCTYGSASVGITLTASNLMVLNDLPWEVATLEQAKKRSHRIGQYKPCRVVNVIGSKVDLLIQRLLNGKSRVIQEVMRDN